MRLALGLFVNPSQTKLKPPRSKGRGSVTMHCLGRANGSASLILNHAGGKYVAFIIKLYRRAKASQAPENRLGSINQRSKCLFGNQSVKQTQHTQTKSRNNAAKSGARFFTDVAPLVRDDEVAAELGGGVLHDKFQLEFALVLDALKIQRRREGLEHLADGSLNKNVSGLTGVRMQRHMS
jgi:hypothetical protein